MNLVNHCHQRRRIDIWQRIGNIFNKMTVENFPNLEKQMPIQIQEASRTPNRKDRNRTSSNYIILKTISTDNKNIEAFKSEK
jgi:hypothetical protein